MVVQPQADKLPGYPIFSYNNINLELDQPFTYFKLTSRHKRSTYSGSHIDIGPSIYERNHFIHLTISGGLPQFHFLGREISMESPDNEGVL